METAIISIICIALIVVGGMTMSQTFLSSVDSASNSLSNVSQIDRDILRTNVSSLGTTLTTPNNLELTLSNSGQTKLSDFSKWDFIVQYRDNGDVYVVTWLPYVSGTPGNNEWAVDGIYMNAASKTPEVFETGILNPGEQAIFRSKIVPAIGISKTGMITVSTPAGVTASAFFTR